MRNLFFATLVMGILIVITTGQLKAETYILYAGQDNPVGTVEVTNDGTNLYVEYTTDDGWLMTEIHLDIGDTPADIPQNKQGNPQVGQFMYSLKDLGGIDNYLFTIPLSDLGLSACDDIIVAAHAKVVKQIDDCWETVWQIGDVETFGCGDGNLLTNYADEFNWSGATECSAGQSLAENTPDFENPFIVGTTPISEFPYNSNKSKDYATDFDVMWSGALPIGGRLTLSWSPGASADEEKVISDGFPETILTATGSNQSGQGWFMDKYPLVNNIDDPIVVYPLPDGEHIINFQHTQGDGTFWDWILLEKPCLQEASAWGEGTQFPGNNWATYFTYTVQCPEPLLINGGFEYPVPGTSQGWDIYDSGTTGLGWTVEWYDGSANYGGQTRPEPAHLEIHKSGTVVDTPDGGQYVELDTDWDGPGGGLNGEPASVRIYQDICTCPGQTYQLSYAWSPRTGNDCDMLVRWGDGVEFSHSGYDAVWTTETQTVTATDYSTRLEFIETGPADSFGMFLDDVSLVPVD